MYDPNDPYGMFRQIPRLQKRRGRAQTLRGGGRGGQVGGINRQVNRGGGGQLAGAQPQVQRAMGGGIPRGGSRTTTGPGQPEQEQEGLLGGLIQAKGTYDTTKDAFSGGKNLAAKAQDLYNNDSSVALRNVFSDTYIPNSGDLRAATEAPSRGLSGLTEAPSTAPSAGLPTNSNLQGLINSPSAQAAGAVSNLSKGAGSTANFVGPMYNPNNIVAGNTARFPGQVIEGVNAGGSSGTAAAGAGGGAAGTSGVNAGVNAGGSTSAKAASSTGSKALGTAGAALGVGLSAYDISQNGANFGNVAGLAGSAILAGTTAFGLANAWNPVGWALLAGSAAYSIFG